MALRISNFAFRRFVPVIEYRDDGPTLSQNLPFHCRFENYAHANDNLPTLWPRRDGSDTHFFPIAILKMIGGLASTAFDAQNSACRVVRVLSVRFGATHDVAAPAKGPPILSNSVMLKSLVKVLTFPRKPAR